METSDRPTKQDKQFRTDLVALTPRMRSFALSLCHNAGQADDLVQDALLKAWEFRSHYQSGTQLSAWVFTILRHKFYDDRRRSWRQCSLEPDVAENTLLAVSDPIKTLELDELRRALAGLKTEQREAVILIGAGGFGYEEVAAICGAAVGTIKSRTSRARARLHEILDTGAFVADGERCDAAMSNILAQVQQISGGRAVSAGYQ
jgi:RNA polymerase sigma-70 factor (ECF subfamily)